MKVLVVGAGGREHALVWKISQSEKVSSIYCAPGNAGIAALAECMDIADSDITGLVKFAKEQAIDLTVIGPEVPLVMGISDAFAEAGLKVFGPSEKASQFEGSKAVTKEFLEKYNIPTARYKEFTKVDAALKDPGILGYPVVVKADGLAAGKGVLICQNEEETKQAINDIMTDRQFGEAGDKVVLEEYLDGIEASILCFVDGKSIVPMESARDYKRALDNDEGLNTGGMGTYSPNSLFDNYLEQKVKKTVLTPVIEGLQKEGIDYRGILFIGLMIIDNQPYVLEFNVRFGDPETQSVLMRLETDLIEIFESVIDGTLENQKIEWSAKEAVCIVAASGGYPGNYEKGKVISGLADVKNSIVFHAGTRMQDGVVATNGGRVLGVSSLGKTREEARSKVYADMEKISFEGMQYRKDIAQS